MTSVFVVCNLFSVNIRNVQMSEKTKALFFSKIKFTWKFLNSALWVGDPQSPTDQSETLFQ